MVLPAPPPVITTAVKLHAQHSVCLDASVPRELWTAMECACTPLSAQPMDVCTVCMYVPYSGKFLQVQVFVKMPLIFIFA